MSEADDEQPTPADALAEPVTLRTSVVKHSLILAAFAVIVALSVGMVDRGTRDEIEYQRQQAERRALAEVMPPALHDNDLLNDTLPLSPQAGHENLDLLNLADGRNGWVARRDGETTGIILPSIAPDGYSGNIELIVGIRADATLTGVRVVSHSETPGLGDKIELRIDDWILDFAGRSLDEPPAQRWQVRKDGGDFDQFTGATITPRAVVNAVRRTLEFFEQNRADLLAHGQAVK